jgi:hypothetical protein
MPSSTSCKPTERADSARRSFFSRRLISLAITSVLLTGGIVGGVLMGPVKNAEAKAGQEAKSSTDSQKLTDNQKLWEELDDIDWMHDLGPLKLTPEQIDKMIALLEQANTKLAQDVNDLTTNTIGQVAADIHTEHKDALSGTPIPKEFDTKVQEKVGNFFARRKTVINQLIEHMSDAFSKVLTEDQKKIMIKLGKDYFTKMGNKPGPNDTDDTFYNLYVTNVFINKYPRIVPLLKEVKASSK